MKHCRVSLGSMECMSASVTSAMFPCALPASILFVLLYVSRLQSDVRKNFNSEKNGRDIKICHVGTRYLFFWENASGRVVTIDARKMVGKGDGGHSYHDTLPKCC